MYKICIFMYFYVFYPGRGHLVHSFNHPAVGPGPNNNICIDEIIVSTDCEIMAELSLKLNI